MRDTRFVSLDIEARSTMQRAERARTPGKSMRLTPRADIDVAEEHVRDRDLACAGARADHHGRGGRGLRG